MAEVAAYLTDDVIPHGFEFDPSPPDDWDA